MPTLPTLALSAGNILTPPAEFPVTNSLRHDTSWRRSVWMAAGDQLARAGQERMQDVDDTYLKKTTVFPDSQFMGLLWFSRQKTFQSGMLSVTIGARNYEFPFPPPETAKAPTAPGIPTTATAVATVPILAGAIDKESAAIR